MTDIRFYIAPDGSCPFEHYITAMPAPLAVDITRAVEKIASGLKGNIKSVGHGISEYKIYKHGGLRLYFGWDEGSVILLMVGRKKRQSADIMHARVLWTDYLQQKQNSQ